MSHLIDIAFVVVFLITPAWMMSQSTRLLRAFLLSSLLCWAALMVGEALIDLFDPSHDNMGTRIMLLLFGWAPGTIYCGIWAAVLSLGRWLDRRT